MERMKTRNMNPAKAFYDEGEGSGEHGGKGIDDRGGKEAWPLSAAEGITGYVPGTWAISRAQYDKSLGDLTVKMGMEPDGNPKV